MTPARKKKKVARDLLHEEAVARRKTEERVRAPRWAYLVAGLALLGLVLLALVLMLIGALLPT